jgi:transcriptional regulator GlxA family with amidase domain
MTSRSQARQPRRIAIFTYDRGQSLDVTGPLEVFSIANRLLLEGQPDSQRFYDTEILAPRAGTVTMSSGLRLLADRAYFEVRGSIDTLVVAGGDLTEVEGDTRLLRWLARTQPRLRRLASVCSGAFILAEAGLLDGRRATTHWRWAGVMSARYPQTDVDPDALFVRDGNIYTSAGVTAGMDLALALVEEDLGHRLALSVARHMVLFLKRPGGQKQFSSHLQAQSMPRGLLGDLPEWILDHLEADLSVEALAQRVAMSPRNFARVFTRELGTTPAKFVERARVERARRALEEDTAPMESVAGACGFGSSERMRRSFQRHLRVVPQDYRKRFVNARTGQTNSRRESA